MWIVKINGVEYTGKIADTLAISIAMELITNVNERLKWAYQLFKEMSKLEEGERKILNWSIGEIVVIHSWPEINFNTD